VILKRDLRKDAWTIIRAAILGTDPEKLTNAALSTGDSRFSVGGLDYDFASFKNIYLIGTGKAAASMARGAETALGERITEGIVSVKDGYGRDDLVKVEVLEAAHPVPDERGAAATRRLLELAEKAGEDDLVIFLISGGGSALMALPAGELKLADLKALTEALLKSGASIGEINAVRKHLFNGTGGGMVRAAWPARMLTLIISDVIGDNLDVIASGPTVPDTSTYADAFDVLHKYGLEDSAAPALLSHLRAGLMGEAAETPKPGDRIFERVNNVVLASNRTALDAAAIAAGEIGYNVFSLTSMLEGEARDMAGLFSIIARDEEQHGRPLPVPACLLAGGETTVTVTGKGKGGRAQEFTLAAAARMQDLGRSLIFAVGTDGTDGPTEAAGALALADTVSRAMSLGIDVRRSLDNNDSNSFFRALGDLIVTGPTLTNVNDIYGVLVTE
jgi:glycerate-2-kinase